MPFAEIDDRRDILVHDSYSCKELLGKMGAVWDRPSKSWRLVMTVANVEMLLDRIPDLELAADFDKFVQDQIERERKLEAIVQMAKMDDPVGLRVAGLKMQPYNYQKLGVMFAVTNGYGMLLADEMGLGKTLQAITYCEFLRTKGKAEKCLIITPASLKYNWPIEIEKFTDAPYVVIDSKYPDERIAQWLTEDAFFYVANYEIVLEDLFGGREYKIKKTDSPEVRERKERLAQNAAMRQRVLAGVRKRLWDVIVVDEAHGIKNPVSKRTKNIKALNGKFRMALTGTPLDGRLEELHTVMGFVAPGLLGSRTKFLDRYAERDFFGAITGYRNVDQLRALIRPFFLRRLKKDVLKDLPDKVYENRIVSFSAVENRIYKELAEQGHEMTAETEAMVAVLRCRQFCNWPPMIDPKCSSTSKMDSFVEVVVEVVGENGHKALVFTQYKEMLDIIAEKLEQLGFTYLRIDGDTPKQRRAEMQKEFNEGKHIDLMIGTEAMSTGLNFTAADYVINYDDSWAPSLMNQRSDRCHRIGQKNVVTVVSFICRNTVESRVRQVLKQKEDVTKQAVGDNIADFELVGLKATDIVKLL